MVKNPQANARDMRAVGSIPGLGRSPGGEYGTHSSILTWRIPKDRGAWQATVQEVAELDTTKVTWHTHLLGLVWLQASL